MEKNLIFLFSVCSVVKASGFHFDRRANKMPGKPCLAFLPAANKVC